MTIAIKVISHLIGALILALLFKAIFQYSQKRNTSLTSFNEVYAIKKGLVFISIIINGLLFFGSLAFLLYSLHFSNQAGVFIFTTCLMLFFLQIFYSTIIDTFTYFILSKDGLLVKSPIGEKFFPFNAIKELIKRKDGILIIAYNNDKQFICKLVCDYRELINCIKKNKKKFHNSINANKNTRKPKDKKSPQEVEEEILQGAKRNMKYAPKLAYETLLLLIRDNPNSSIEEESKILLKQLDDNK